MADQALSSATNVGLLIFLAAFLNSSQFGAFALAYGVYTFVLQVCQSAIGEPMIVARSRADSQDGLTVGVAVSVSLAFALIASIGTAVGGVASTAPLNFGLLSLAVTFPGLLAHDALRLHAIARNAPRQAFFLDAGWASFLVVAFGLLTLENQVTITSAMLAWGASASLTAVIGGVCLRVRFQRSFWSAYLRVRSLTQAYVVESVSLAGSMQLTLFLVAGVAGLAEVGYLRAAQAFLGPINVFFNAIRLFGVTVISRGNGRVNLSRVFTLSAAAVICTLSLGVALILFPVDHATAFLGSVWNDAHPLLLPLTIERALSGASIAILVALRISGSVGGTMVRRLFYAASIVVLGTGGAAVAGSFGAAIGLAISSCLAVGLFADQLRRTRRAEANVVYG